MTFSRYTKRFMVGRCESNLFPNRLFYIGEREGPRGRSLIPEEDRKLLIWDFLRVDTRAGPERILPPAGMILEFFPDNKKTRHEY